MRPMRQVAQDAGDELPAYCAEAAQLWCKPQFSGRVMDTEFAQAIASLIQMEVTKAVGRALRPADPESVSKGERG